MGKIFKNKLYLSFILMISVLFGLGGCGGDPTGIDATYMDGKNEVNLKEFGNTDGNQRGNTIIKDSNNNILVGGYRYHNDNADYKIGGFWSFDNDLKLLQEQENYAIDEVVSVAIDANDVARIVGNYNNLMVGWEMSDIVNFKSDNFVSFANSNTYATSVVLDSSNNIYIAGKNNNNQLTILKLNSSGILVSNFGNSGIATYSGSSTSVANAMAVDSSNNIYITGIDNDKMTLWKYSSDGTLDTTFGTNGIVTTTVTSSGNAMLLDSSNNIFISGTSGDKMTLWKYTSNGTLTTTVTYPSSEKSRGYGIALDTTKNKIYATGMLAVASLGSVHMSIWRYDTNLTLDTKFSEDGVYSFKYNVSGMVNYSEGFDIVIGSTGDLYITGTGNSTMGYEKMAVWKYKFYIDTTAPTFSSNANANVNENNISAITLVATDESSVTYSISGGDSSSFNIDSSTGIVTFKTAPDYETKTSYTFTATATDESNNTKTQAVTININDIVETITYATVTSPLTGKIWLDRNLGASQVCTSATDTACFGDYYQWGRSADGHEKSTSTTNATQATTITSVGNQFITVTGGDWTTADSDGALRSANWSKTDGTSICPSGFRVPTLSELKAEFPDSTYKSYSSFLKIPTSKVRSKDGSMYDGMGGYSALWASDAVSGNFANRIYFYGTDVSMADGLNDKASGYSIRCIKN